MDPSSDTKKPIYIAAFMFSFMLQAGRLDAARAARQVVPHPPPRHIDPPAASVLLSVLKNVHAVSRPDRMLPRCLKQALHRDQIPVRQLHRMQSISPLEGPGITPQNLSQRGIPGNQVAVAAARCNFAVRS